MRAWWVAIVGLVTTPAMAADQFDLVCTAKKTTVRYRIDLAKAEWCSEGCVKTYKMASITTGELVLEDEQPQYPGGNLASVRVSRTSGSWSEIHAFAGAGAPISREGHCEPAPFSGFPTAKF